MDRGLWSWSRHPNYFGEFGFWFAAGAVRRRRVALPTAWWLFVGAVAMLAMFLGASIPMMEKRSLERRPGYQAVIDRVPRFVPRPPAAAEAARVTRPTVVIAGLGDSGVLTAIKLARHADVVGISAKPGTGQRPGTRAGGWRGPTTGPATTGSRSTGSAASTGSAPCTAP